MGRWRGKVSDVREQGADSSFYLLCAPLFLQTRRQVEGCGDRGERGGASERGMRRTAMGCGEGATPVGVDVFFGE